MKKQLGIVLLLMLWSALCSGQEICDNGIDDDGDSLTDLMDDECDCQDIFDDTVYLPNGDFEDIITCCSRSEDFSGGDCLEDWIAVNGSPEHINPNCYTNLSEAEEAKGAPIEDNFIGLRYDDFRAFVFKETFGTCTNATLLPENLYRISVDGRMSTNDELTAGTGNPYLYFYGLRTCEELVFSSGTEGELCDLGFNLIPIDSIAFDEIPFDDWKTIERDIRPSTEINAIIVAFDCKQDFFYDTKRFVLLDDISISRLLSEEFDFDLSINPQGSLCDNNFSINTTVVPDVSYQWYKDEVAILGQTSGTLTIDRDEALSGNYQLRIADADGCFETDSEDILVAATTEDTTICLGQSLDISTGSYDSDGIYTEDLSSTFSCINKTYNLSIDDLIEGGTIQESFQEGTSFSFGGMQFSDEGDYDVTLKTAEGCDSLVTLSLREVDFTIRVPNIFTPSKLTDDLLTVYGKAGSAVVVRTFNIYDRWGNEVFSKQNFLPNMETEGWDGKLANDMLSQGIYSYFVEMEFVDGSVRSSSGEILLLK